MIVYVDSSVIARMYLVDEVDHATAAALLDNPEIGLVTGTWSRIEVSGALVRAARSGRGNVGDLLDVFDADTGSGGSITIVEAEQQQVEERALQLVRAHGIRAMDAWHLATAMIVLTMLVEPDENFGFASRDREQAAAAAMLGMEVI